MSQCEISKVGNKRLASELSTGSSIKKARIESTSQSEEGSDSLLICYDLELTDGSFASEIYQLGAKCGSGSFSRNILPRGDIDWGVTKFATNITVKKDNFGNRQLYDTKLKEFVPSFNAKDSYAEFLKWIEDQKILGKHKNVILIAQGNMDMLALVNNVARAGLMEDLLKDVDMFGDSLKYFQNTCKTWTKFNLSFVYGQLFPDRPAFKAHSAIEDAIALHDILEKLGSQHTREVFISDLERASVKSSLCTQIAKNKISKTLSKSAKKNNSNNYVIKFLASDLVSAPVGKPCPRDSKPFSTQTNEHPSSDRKFSREESKAPLKHTDKHPVMLLNELNSGASVNYFNFHEESRNNFVIECVINDKTFRGKGANKKEAKKNCALKVLDEIHHITY